MTRFGFTGPTDAMTTSCSCKLSNLERSFDPYFTIRSNFLHGCGVNQFSLCTYVNARACIHADIAVHMPTNICCCPSFLWIPTHNEAAHYNSLLENILDEKLFWVFM